jgi:hypothetical protein
MINSALTRWLKQGLAQGLCPLCRVSHKLDREYIWSFFDEWSSQDDHIDGFARARGFCADHAEQLRRTEVVGLHSTLGISDLYLAALRRLRTDLIKLSDDGSSETRAALTSTKCPACVYQQKGLATHARYLLQMLSEDESYSDRLAACGLCVPHFQLVWDAATGAEERERLARIECALVERLIGELEEHIRKQRAEFRGEPAGAEADSWRRAIWLTSGWPPSSAPASLPEARSAASGTP